MSEKVGLDGYHIAKVFFPTKSKSANANNCQMRCCAGYVPIYTGRHNVRDRGPLTTAKIKPETSFLNNCTSTGRNMEGYWFSEQMMNMLMFAIWQIFFIVFFFF